MTERKFFPAASVWHLMPKLMEADRPVGWLTVEDLAVIAAKAFGDPDRVIGREVMLASDVQSIEWVPGHLARGDGPAAPAIPDASLAVRAVRGARRDDHMAMAGRERGRL